jgi:signal transduction histidine kinase
VQPPFISIVYLFYGLAFFSMGLAITLEAGRGSDERLRNALRPLAGFGLLHGLHEWIEMFLILRILPIQEDVQLLLESARVAILAFSFLSLAAFGASLLSRDQRTRRLSLMVPLILAAIWGFGLLLLKGDYPIPEELWDVADVWSRYSLAIPSALFASVGLIAQQRAFRRVGLARFGQDSLWAAVAFAWYGIIGQAFTRPSPLPPSNVINQVLFRDLFGFPVQLMRAVAAILAAVFVTRFLRSFEVERQRQLSELQAERLKEAQRREAMRGELLKRVVAAQEAERQRIARELHDETGQAMTAIGLGLRGIATNLRGSEGKVTQNLHQLEELIAHSLNELQRIISDLRPSHLDDLGLAAALRWYVGEIQQRAPLKVNVHIEGEHIDLPQEMKTGLFRIVQEALTNVVRHADAERADVYLRYGKHNIWLDVIDDGVGFSLTLASMDSKRPSWGLAGMEERTHELGGKFAIESQPGEGTRVSVVIPYQENGEEDDDDSSNVGG